MRRIGRRPSPSFSLAAMLICGVFAGCASAGSEATATSVPPAPAPKPQVDMGSIVGMVTDEELRPLPRADVGLVGGTATLETDAGGRYTFNDVAPGSYGLAVQALGYESQTRKVSVVAGAVTHANFTLRAVAIEEEFTETVHVGNLIFLSHAFVNYYVPREIEPCGECHHYREIRAKSKEAMVETIYTNGIPQPLDDLWYNMNKNWTNATGSSATRGGQHIKSGYIKSYGQSRFSDTEMGNLKGVTKVMIYLAGGYTSVSVNKRVDFWFSLSYGEEFPENFTALPPR